MTEISNRAGHCTGALLIAFVIACSTTESPTSPPPVPNGVLQFHNNASRDGLYVAPAFTRAAAANVRIDAAFHATTAGPTYAQPLYFEGGPGGKDVIVVATEQNQVCLGDWLTHLFLPDHGPPSRRRVRSVRFRSVDLRPITSQAQDETSELSTRTLVALPLELSYSNGPFEHPQQTLWTDLSK